MPSKKVKANTFKLNKIYTLILSILTVVLGLFTIYFVNTPQIKVVTSKNDPILYDVSEVIDGDTFRLKNNMVIRLAGLDASEQGLCYSKESKDYLSSLIKDKQVTLKFDRVGVYSRVNAYVFVEETFVNNELLKNGYARYEGRSSHEQMGLKEATEYAQQNKLGIFDQCISATPPNENCQIKGNIAKRNKTQKFYHFKGCSAYDSVIVDLDRGEQWFCSEKEAMEAGFKKAKTCYDKPYE